MGAPDGVAHVTPCPDCAPLVRMMLRDLARRAGVSYAAMAVTWGQDVDDD